MGLGNGIGKWDWEMGLGNGIGFSKKGGRLLDSNKWFTEATF